MTAGESVFVDTNVFVYARDESEPSKMRRALAWIDALWTARSGRISAQVLSEYYVTVTRKLSPGLPVEEAREDVRSLSTWEPLPIDHRCIETAFTVQDRYGLSWWDSLIAAAAHRSAAHLLLSEDFQDGQELLGVRVVNPFRNEPGETPSN
ncbi:MAG: PIN domain-containing protein [Planctomycetota bacterium]